MKISIKQSLIEYCYKADNYNEFIRRVKLLINFVQRMIDKIFIQSLVTDIKIKGSVFHEK